MTIMEVNVNRPKPQKKASKKNKKSWRKNTELDDVEDFLDDQRLEERLGGAFDKRSDSDIFVVDTAKDEATECSESTSINISKREARKKTAREKSLKCFSNLDVNSNSGVQDPKKGRDSRKTPEQRKNPTIKKKEEELAKAGMIREKMKKAILQRKKQKEQKDATMLNRRTRRRTNFDFDLWNTDVTAEGDIKEPEDENGMSKNQWLENQTVRQNLNNSGQMKRAPPKDFYLKESTLPAVDTPHGGASYNPSYKEHQDLLWKAAMDELNKEKKQHKIDFHTTNMFPKSGAAPAEETWLKEMSEGMNESAANEEEDKDKDIDNESSEAIDDESKSNKLKTRKQRKKELKLKMKEKRKKFDKREKLRVQDVFKIKTLNKEIKAEEQKIAQNMAKRKELKETKKNMPADITGHKFEEQDIDIKLTEELTGSLRSLKPEGNLLTDRYKSMQKRNIIETRVKQKIVKNKRKRKLAEKRNYKMGFDWEKK